MENMVGSLGTSSSFALRFGQTFFSASSLFILCFGGGYSDFTACLYLATVMSIVTPWSFLLAMMDLYSVIVKQVPEEASFLSIILSGDLVMSFLSLAGASAVSSVTDQLLSFGGHICDAELCIKYQISAVFALMSWFLLLASAISNFWILPSLCF